MKQLVVAGNWKMNMDALGGAALIEALLTNFAGNSIDQRVEVILCPPFPLLGAAAKMLEGASIKLGAQNMHFEKEGAFTGEVSGSMLTSSGCSHVIVGHSERRQYFGETDGVINKKALAGLQAGLSPIICVGETLEQRESGITESVVGKQVSGVLEHFSEEELAASMIAYEPVWAIGTGRNATPEQAQEVHLFIRRLLEKLFSAPAAWRMQLLYGGSMKAGNAFELLSQPDVDGGLVGGASLDAQQFSAIVAAAGEAAAAKEH